MGKPPVPVGRDIPGWSAGRSTARRIAGGRARRVLNVLGTDIAAIKRELECYVTGKPRRRGSRWKRPAARAGRACSFCGRSEKIAGRLVAGPGVHICGGCVALAADILRREAA